MEKRKKPEWFKDKSPSILGLLEITPDDTVGKAYKLAADYFSKGEIIDITNLGIQDTSILPIFSLFKQWADEGITEYQQSVENGKKGGRPTHKDKSHPNPL